MSRKSQRSAFLGKGQHTAVWEFQPFDGSKFQNLFFFDQKLNFELKKRNEERSINSLLYSTFADVKFEKIKSEPPKERIQFKPIRYKIQSSPR